MCLGSKKFRSCVRRYLAGRVGARLQYPSGEVLTKVRQHLSRHQPTGAAALQGHYFRSVSLEHRFPFCPFFLGEPTHISHLHRRRTSNITTDVQKPQVAFFSRATRSIAMSGSGLMARTYCRFLNRQLCPVPGHGCGRQSFGRPALKAAYNRLKSRITILPSLFPFRLFRLF